jgi:hypothetical protein
MTYLRVSADCIQPLRDRYTKLRGFKQLRIADNVFGPKLPHHPLHVIRPEAPIRMFVVELTQAGEPRIWVARVWRKGCISRLMNDALRSDIELVAPDWNVPHDFLTRLRPFRKRRLGRPTYDVVAIARCGFTPEWPY